jgi:hypothetical protein
MSHFDERLKQYGNPRSRSHWHGQSTAENIARWVGRAEQNSDSYRHRAKSGPIELPGDVAGPMVTHTAGAGSGVGREDAAHRQAKRDSNHRGGSHMKGVRRTTG